MTDVEKRTAMVAMIAPDTDTPEVLDSMIIAAKAMILNKMYPFGYDEGLEVPPRYEQLQIMLAVELYNKRGAEGQTGHSENGVSRSWSNESALLAKVIPHCGSVSIDA